MFAPFLVGFALCISDGDADLPQHLLVDLADRCSQRPDGGRGVEIKDRHEIFVVEVAFRLQSAAGHQSVSDADGGGCLELHSDVILKSYTDTAYHNEELKSLTRYRFDKVQERAKLKQSVSRLVTILFPELEQLVSSIHGTSIYALLSEYPGAKQISEAHLTRLANILVKTSRGHYRKDKATHIRDAARTSIGSVMPAKSLELKHTIKLIQELTSEINEIEDAIRKIMDELKPPILSIPGMGFHSAAMILAEVGDFSNFNSPDKVLAYAGCSPSTYQSGKLTNCYAHMEKRGSRYLRYALYTATKYVCYWNPVFTEYLTKKQAEGKHYNVALSHATKKLVRLIYALQKSGKAYLAVT